MDDSPEFNTKTLSPLSPQPLHSSLELSKILVLQNQTDTFFGNMTSNFESIPVAAQADPTPPSAVPDDGSNSSPASSFSSAYKEATRQATNVDPTEDEDMAHEETSDDDYDMAVDTDEEEQSVSRDVSRVVSQPTIEQESSLLSTSSSKVPIYDIQDQRVQIEPSKPVPSPSLPSATAAPTQSPASIQAGADVSHPRTHTYEQIANGEVDIQALLDNITANAEKYEAVKDEKTQATSTSLSTSQPKYSLPPKPSVGLLPHASLPPRPQVPARASLNDEEISKHQPTQVQGQSQTQVLNTDTSLYNTYRPPLGVNVPLGAPGTFANGRGDLPPPPGIFKAESPSSSNVQYPPPPGVKLETPHGFTGFAGYAGYGLHDMMSSNEFQGTYQEYNRPSSAVSSNNTTEAKWPLSIQQKYDMFLNEERRFIADQSWESFPPGSRLFIGNLNGGSVTKRDIFHVFHRHGRIAQIAVKPAYGFVQFHDNASCLEAVRVEQGAIIRGNPMQLQVSKANKVNKTKTAAPRRTGSPDNSRGGMTNRNGRRGHDAPARDEYGRPLNESHTRRRSPSPARGNFRGRDTYSSRSRGDFYDGRDSRRSRSRSPFRPQNNEYRNRSPSPKRDELHQVESSRDGDPIRHRNPSDVPDIQIYLTCTLDRNYISWIESGLRSKGLRTDVMMYDHRLSEDSLIRRQILDGVHAISKLGIDSQSKGKMSVKIFERKSEGEEVSFNEYIDLDPSVVAELIILVKKRSEDAKAAQVSNLYDRVPQIPPHSQYPPPPSYQQPTMGNYQQYQNPQPYRQAATQHQPPPTTAAATPDISNLVNQLDNDALQKLLSSLATQPQQQNTPAAAINSSIDLAGILGGLQKQTQQYQPPVGASYASPTNTQYNGNGAAQQPAYQGEAVQQVQIIMAQLAKYRP